MAVNTKSVSAATEAADRELPNEVVRRVPEEVAVPGVYLGRGNQLAFQPGAQPDAQRFQFGQLGHRRLFQHEATGAHEGRTNGGLRFFVGPWHWSMCPRWRQRALKAVGRTVRITRTSLSATSLLVPR